MMSEQKENQLSEKEELSAQDLEKLEEQKLKARQPQMNRPGHSAFLQKRLAKGQKYFDSGDYNMAKQKAPAAVARMPPQVLPQPTGDTIPTPDSLPIRKTSIVQSKLASPAT
uniref:EOG090X0P2R n=1 Tax=Lynceus sp. MCZ IZ 141354 TaxID=1930659 RepID=A0A9N6ZEX4_9CRUS|nr:EOG090X0P2R [Lynceus sp. MCZ IZ 141354]